MSDEKFTHQEGLTAAAKLAGAGLDVVLYLVPRRGEHREHAVVSVDLAYPTTIDGAIEVRQKCRAAGYDADLEGTTMKVTKPWKAGQP